MGQQRSAYRCQSCGVLQARWSGRCGSCAQWNTLVEVPAGSPDANRQGGRRAASSTQAVALQDVSASAACPRPTGIGELDRVLGGGLLPGSATLIGGEPGTGKSTLLLQAMAALASSGSKCLLVAAEEAAHQVRRRAQRLGADVAGVFVLEATVLPAVEEAICNLAPDVVVVDSVQAVSDPAISSPPGSLAQVRGCAQALVGLAKARGTALVLVGHVNKEGALAGPRVLEHLVDTVLTFEGDRYLALRALRAVKHRFGPTGETGLFEMGEHGLSSVADPSALFLGDRLKGAPGSAVTVTLEGHRPVLVEVQALVGRAAAVPRRSVTGLDPNRVALLVAVLDRRAGVRVSDRDIYVSVAGGARAYEPAADLAICLALASSFFGTALPPEMVALGEVGLGGELRQVTALTRRLTEASRLGFRSALVPASTASERNCQPRAGPSGAPRPSSLHLQHAAALAEAVGCVVRPPAPLQRPSAAHEPARHELTSAGARTPERGHDRGPYARRPRWPAAGGP